MLTHSFILQTLMQLRGYVAKKMNLNEESLSMNPDLQNELPEGVHPQLLWSKGPLHDMTKNNLPLTLTDLHYDR